MNGFIAEYRRLNAIKRYIESREYQIKALIEYRLQLLDQLDTMTEVGIKSSDDRFDRLYCLIKDTSFSIWHMSGAQQ